MNNNVKVTADQNGNVITVSSNNPEYGWFFVEQNTVQLENGWLRNVTRKARIMGKVEDLKECDYRAGEVLPGKITIVESLTPFNVENPDRDLKVAGSTGIVCRVEDQPIYRQVFYTTNTNANDELIKHTNSLEIKEVLSAQRNISLLNTRVDSIKEPQL